MIHIDINSQNVKEASSLWLCALRSFMFGKHFKKMKSIIEDEYKNGSLVLQDKLYSYCMDMLAYYKLHFNEIVLAQEVYMQKICSIMDACSSKYPNVMLVMKKVFIGAYKGFCQYNYKNTNVAYQVMKKLNVNVCPYCNRQYTFTIDETKKSRPDFDHFYDKATYPLLALSFYNLIPSCHICNHVKGNDRAAINPYFGGFEHEFRVKPQNPVCTDDVFTLDSSELQISLDKCSQGEHTNMETFGLESLYNQHLDYVDAIMDRVKSYNLAVQKDLVDTFQGAGYEPKDVFDFVWGPYLGKMQDNNWPLAKLTKDILHQFGIVKSLRK